MIRFPENIGTKAFQEKIEDKLTFSPYEEEDLVAMSFCLAEGKGAENGFL